MKIAFIGDSYCAHYKNKNNHWPGIVANKLNAEIIQTGFEGRPFYTAMQSFFKKMIDADIVICCVTQPFRLHNRHNIPITPAWIRQMKAMRFECPSVGPDKYYDIEIPAKKVSTIAKAAHLYYTEICDEQEGYFSNISRISYFDNLLKKNNKKVIWFPCFDDSFLWSSNWSEFSNTEYYIPVSGPSANISLYTIERARFILSNPSVKEKDIDVMIANTDTDSNHFPIKENNILAEIVLNIIENNKFSPDIIKMEEYFSYMDLSKACRVRE